MNPDGSILLSSSDEAALEAFQQKLAEIAAEKKAAAEPAPQAEPAAQAPQTAENATATETENNVQLTESEESEDRNDFLSQNGYLSYMTEENMEKARSRVLMESRNYTVYRVENVGVNQIVPRLQTYLADRINRRNVNNYYDYYSSSGVNVQTIGTNTNLTFQADVALNTLMVYGTKADRDAVGALLVVLDDVTLFPQPITKPYKIKVENTSPTRMAQQVLSAFSRKFQTTLLPGNLSPRIMPNMATNSLEVYAPEALAKEIEEYVKEVDKDILEESVRKVRVVELHSINSKVLAQYLTNLRTQQTLPQTFSTPYIGGAGMFSPMTSPGMMNAMARQRAQGGYGGYGGGYGGYGGGYGGSYGGAGRTGAPYPGAGAAAGRIPRGF